MTSKAVMPWVGFAVRRARGKNSIFVVDVSERGPADEAGIRNGDELITFAGVRTATMKQFRGALKQNLVAGRKIKIELMKKTGVQKTVTLLVDFKKGDMDTTPVPRIRTVADVREVLADPSKLERLSSAAFSLVDVDQSGLVTKPEFMEAMTKNLCDGPLAAELENVDFGLMFNNVDVDGSGYIAKSEFKAVLTSILQSIISSAAFGRSTGSFAVRMLDQEMPDHAHPWLGFAVKPISKDFTVVVVSVDPAGPAWQAGLTVGDEVVSVGLRPINSLETYRAALKSLRPGEETLVEIIRPTQVNTAGAAASKRQNLSVVVEVKSYEYIPLPSLNTLEDVVIMLEDEIGLSQLADSLFMNTDIDFIGLLTLNEFKGALKTWLAGNMVSLLSDYDLKKIFRVVDEESCGMVTMPEFREVLSITLQKIRKRAAHHQDTQLMQADLMDLRAQLEAGGAAAPRAFDPSAEVPYGTNNLDQEDNAASRRLLHAHIDDVEARCMTAIEELKAMVEARMAECLDIVTTEVREMDIKHQQLKQMCESSIREMEHIGIIANNSAIATEHKADEINHMAQALSAKGDEISAKCDEVYAAHEETKEIVQRNLEKTEEVLSVMHAKMDAELKEQAALVYSLKDDVVQTRFDFQGEQISTAEERRLVWQEFEDVRRTAKKEQYQRMMNSNMFDATLGKLRDANTNVGLTLDVARVPMQKTYLDLSKSTVCERIVAVDHERPVEYIQTISQARPAGYGSYTSRSAVTTTDEHAPIYVQAAPSVERVLESEMDPIYVSGA